MNRFWWVTLAFYLFLVACGMTTEVPDDGETEITPAPTEVAIGEDGEPIETTTTLPPEEAADTEDEDSGPLNIATLLPVESGVDEGDHWFKWQLGTPISDPVDEYIKTYQLTIRSLEDDIFGLGYTVGQNEEPFVATFCLEDRPNCATGTFPAEVDVLDNGGTLLFRVPLGSFEEATELRVGAHITSFPEQDSDPQNEIIGDGVSIPVELVEKDPC